jgi:hypothetical protein
MTEEQEIISSGSPHEVHLAEGSNTALHKSAAATQPQIRNTLANPNEEVALVEIVQGVSHSVADKTDAADVWAHDDAPAAEREHLVSGEDGPSENVIQLAPVQPTQAVPASDAPPLEVAHAEVPPVEVPPVEVPAVEFQPMEIPSMEVAPEDATPLEVPLSAPAAQEALDLVDTNHASVSNAAKPVHSEEMNFPARVVKLKLANEQIRIQIEKLEIPLFSPIAMTASVAKGKPHAPAPAKGH